MTAVLDLLSAIEELRGHGGRFTEDHLRLIVEGEVLSEAMRQRIQQAVKLIDRLGVEAAMFMVSGQPADLAGLSESTYDGEPWRLILGKNPIAERMRARDRETTLMFFSVAGFHQWLKHWDPFVHPESNGPDLAQPTTIRVNGLAAGFGGPLLWVLPPQDSAAEEIDVKLPAPADVHSLIHINTFKPVRVCPAAYALTWGNLDHPDAAPLVLISARVLAACLVQELKQVDERYEVMLRGTKRLSLPLYGDTQAVTVGTLKKLVETVHWVYEERAETRSRLIMDRLSIDIEEGLPFLSGIEKFLGAALQQARDSYAFVILDRKDAYHKEVRELMKDMKSQADLYAAKVRDLVNALTRDVLGVLVFIGFSFIGKFDQSHLQALLASRELALLVKFLAGYLVLSCVLQLSAHLRDANLAYEESKKWLDVLQHYSSQADQQNRFLTPLEKRRKMLFLAMFIIGSIYFLLAIATWSLPSLISYLLA